MKRLQSFQLGRQQSRVYKQACNVVALHTSRLFECILWRRFALRAARMEMLKALQSRGLWCS